MRRRLPGRLHPRVRADPDHRSRGVHRLRRVRTGVPGGGDLPEDALPDKWNAFVEINYAFPDPRRSTRSSTRTPPSTTSRTSRSSSGEALPPRRGSAGAVARERRRRDLRDAEAALAVLDLGAHVRPGRPAARGACSRRETRRRRGSPLCPFSSLTAPILDACARAEGGSSTRIVEPRGYRASDVKRALRSRRAPRAPRALRSAARVGRRPETTSSAPPPDRRPERDLDPCRRAAPHRLVDRLADDLVEAVCACSPRSSPCSTSMATDVLARSARPARRARPPEAELAKRAWLEVLAQRAQVARASRAALEAAREHLVRPLRPAVAQRRERRVEDLRDRRQVLDGPVVEQLREPPPLLLLGEDPLREERARSASREVNRSSPREARWRPPACACPLRASRGCGARGSSRSPG